MDKVNELIIALSNEPFNPEFNIVLAIHYESMGQTAAAVSFYLRAAEYGYYSHPEIVYASLLKSSYCFSSQKFREHTVKNLIEKAIAYAPKRPEAWFLLSRLYERDKKWQESYTAAEVGLSNLPFNGPSLRVNVEYVGDFVLEFQKAVAAWWIGRQDESQTIFQKLIKQELPPVYYNAIKSNMDNLKMPYSEAKS